MMRVMDQYEGISFEEAKKRFQSCFNEKDFVSFGAGKGWDSLILSVLESVSRHNSRYKNERTWVIQVKEKWGLLRIYLGSRRKVPEYLRILVDEVEQESKDICEFCGKRGKIRNTAWIKTLCARHYNDWIKR